MTPWDPGYDTIIFDLDGTLFRGHLPVPGAVEAVAALKPSLRCLYLSNNGERDSGSLAERLRRLGFDVRSEEIVSSADIVIECMSELGPLLRVLPLTSAELASALRRAGYQLVDDERADVVVVGVNRALTHRRMVHGLRACLGGATLVATNEDPTYPGQDGLRPAAGAYVGFFRGMGFEPDRFCGKPDAWAVRTALHLWGIPDGRRCLFVGDNLRTDVQAAARVGARSALVLSGISRVEDLDASPARPDMVLDSVAALPDALTAAIGRPEG
jgi:HAD superfamily hydrolase (TIGR01450 family)